MKKNKLFILFILLFISICLFLLIFYGIEPDYFWHIKAGEYMFKNGVLTHDVFSWVLNGKYWMSHEWLFEIIIYSFKLLFGKYHTIIYCFISLLSLLSIIFIHNRKNITKNVPYTLMYMTLFAIVSFGFIQARPHMISFCFIALTIWFLNDLYKNENSKKIYFLPLIAILWANIHGGSSNLTYIFAFIFLFSGLFSIKFKNIESNKLTKKQIYKYLIVIVLCMLGICINIHGFKMFIYPYENMLDSMMMGNINEWQPTTFTDVFNYSYFIFIAMVIIIIFFSNKKIRLIDCLLLVATAFLGIKSLRFWLYCPIVMSFVIFDYFDERKLDKGTSLVVSIIIIGLIGAFAFNFRSITNVEYEIYLNKKVIKILKDEKPKRLFNMYDYGGELVYNDIPVFIDGRADLYSKYNLGDYLYIVNCNDNYDSLIDKYDFDYLLVSKKYELYKYLNNDEEYEELYKNKYLVLYKKTVN